MFLEVLQILGIIFLGIVAIVLVGASLLIMGKIIRVFTERRYANIWHDLKPDGSYTVVKILWTDGGTLGMLLHYTEGHASGHAIYECNTATICVVPKEGDQLRPNVLVYDTMAPFYVVIPPGV